MDVSIISYEYMCLYVSTCVRVGTVFAYIYTLLICVRMYISI